MSDRFQEFERLLATPDFWDADVFVQTEELAPTFDNQDWNTICSCWHERDADYKERFLVSITAVTHLGLVELALDLLSASEPTKVDEGLSLLTNSSAQVGQHISAKHLEILARIWYTYPEWRLRIQQMLWSKGKSGQLRRLLGLERWSDITLPNQPAA